MDTRRKITTYMHANTTIQELTEIKLIIKLIYR